MNPEPAEVVTDYRHEGWRALLIPDEDAGQPWGDAHAPALILGRRDDVRFGVEVYVPWHAERIVQAWRRFGDHDLFERYLRQCHGVTAITSASDRDTTVLVLDTADYRTHAGITGGADLAGARDEWQAWLDGDVYGVVVQRRHADPTCRVHRGRTDDEVACWEDVDSCWGFYGRVFAAERATDLLRDHATAGSGSYQRS